MECSQCHIEITRKLDPRTKNHFCSRSCAATYNNTHKPKRIKQRYVCESCGATVSAKHAKRCKICALGRSTSEIVKNTTVGQLKELYKDKNALAYAAKIRGYGKTIYDRSDKPKYCIVCGYDKHYEVCHIKSIASFENTATMMEVHFLDNMIALCPNHHWEFDRGLLKI
jgi:hypothetical protein